MKQVPKYRDGGLLLSMWLCISLVEGVQSKPLALFTDKKSAFVKTLKDYIKLHGVSPHPDVALRQMEQI